MSSLSSVASEYNTHNTCAVLVVLQILLMTPFRVTYSLNTTDCSLYHSNDSSEANFAEKLPLYFLVMAPYPDISPFNPSWTGGPAVVPAAIVAKNLINERDDILMDYRIELIVVDSGCNVSSKAVNNLTEKVFHSRRDIVGIIGPGCSEATTAIASLVTDDRISLIQIAPSATSPDLTNTTLYPNTFRPIVSALGFVHTYIDFIKQKSYRHVGALYEANRPFQTTVYTHFQEELKTLKEEIQLTSFGLFDAQFPLSEFRNKVRIIFIFASADFVHQLLCTAYHEGILFPDYQFIFSNRKPENFYKSFFSNESSYSCEVYQMKRAVSGMIFNDFRLTRRDKNNSNTDARISYNKFNETYTKVRNCHLINKSLGLNDVVRTEHHSGYFDATWALALSLNNSLLRLEEKSLSLSNYTNQMPEITEIVREELLSLSFEGMRGRVEFSEVTHDGANVTFIDIHQVLNISGVYNNSVVGEYNPSMKDNPLIFYHEYIDTSLLPKADFDLLYVMPHTFVGIVVVIAAVFLFVVLLTCHIAYIVWRQHKTVKASSPRLNHLIFAGCYLAIGGTIVYTNTFVFIHVSEKSKVLFTVHCTALHWAATLMYSLIFGTLCVKTWRIYCIFNKYNTFLTEHLNDKILLLFTLLPLTFDVVMNILWNSIYPWHFTTKQGPDLRALAICTTENELVWTVVTTIPKGILTTFILYLAIATRRVHKKEYKETKSISILIFSLILLAGTCLPLTFILNKVTDERWCITLSYVCFCVWFLGSVLLCIILILLPPLFSPIRDKIRMHKNHSIVTSMM